jgi:hypothetical protein
MWLLKLKEYNKNGGYVKPPKQNQTKPIKMKKINLNIEELRTLILNAVMTGNQTQSIDLHNAPDECPMEIIAACEFVLSQFLDNKIQTLKEDDINNAIQNLLKGTN